MEYLAAHCMDDEKKVLLERPLFLLDALIFFFVAILLIAF
jgi:hypothetical protein